jgi:hypothetical protein
MSDRSKRFSLVLSAEAIELAETIGQAQRVPVSRAAVLAESVRRGLAEMAREAGVQVKP